MICVIGKKDGAVSTALYIAKGYIENRSCLNGEENIGLDAINNIDNFCHPVHDEEQQQQAALAPARAE